MMEVFVAVADREYDTQACLLLDRSVGRGSRLTRTIWIEASKRR